MTRRGNIHQTHARILLVTDGKGRGCKKWRGDLERDKSGSGWTADGGRQARRRRRSRNLKPRPPAVRAHPAAVTAVGTIGTLVFYFSDGGGLAPPLGMGGEDSAFNSLLVELGVRGSTSLGDAYSLAESLGLARTSDEWSSLLAELASTPWPAVVHSVSVASPRPIGQSNFIDDTSELRASDELVRYVLRVPPNVDACIVRVLKGVASARSAGVSMTELNGFILKEAASMQQGPTPVYHKAYSTSVLRILDARCAGFAASACALRPPLPSRAFSSLALITHTYTLRAPPPLPPFFSK